MMTQSQARAAEMDAGVPGRTQIAAIMTALERFPLSIIQLMCRIAMATVFWRAGQAKLANWDITLALFRDEYTVPLLPPDLAAMFATSVEVTAPVLLVLGLATRLTTLPMLGMTLVIQLFVYPGAWSVHLIWVTLLLMLLTRGPGALSLDHLIARRFLGR